MLVGAHAYTSLLLFVSTSPFLVKRMGRFESGRERGRDLILLCMYRPEMRKEERDRWLRTGAQLLLGRGLLLYLCVVQEN